MGNLNMVFIIIFILISYLNGSIPYGLLITKKVKGIDIRTVGSGNIGTANAIRAVGFKWGAVVLLCDVLKGALPVLLVMGISKWNPGLIPLKLINLTVVLVGFAAILGHNHSIFLKFTGGKGIATSLGVFLALKWPVALIALVIWGIAVFATKYSSLGSLLGSLSMPFLMILFKTPAEYIVFAFIACAFAFYKHRANIGRLIRGEERKINERTGKKVKDLIEVEKQMAESQDQKTDFVQPDSN